MAGRGPATEHPLGIPQVFGATMSYAVRDELQELVERDLLGPWDGATEQFALRAHGPRERYLVGMLGPKHSPESATKQADQLPDTELGAEGDGEAALSKVPRSYQDLTAPQESRCLRGQDADALGVVQRVGIDHRLIPAAR